MFKNMEDIKKVSYLDIFNYVLWIILFGLSSYLCYFLVQKDLLGINYVKFGIVLMFIIALILLGLCLFKKLKIANSILMILAICGVTFSTMQAKAFFNVYDRMNGTTIFTESELVVAVPKKSEITDINQLVDKNIAYSEIDKKNVEELTKELKKDYNIKIEPFEMVSYPEVYESMLEKKSDAIILNEVGYGLIESDHPKFKDEIRIIYKKKVKQDMKNKVAKDNAPIVDIENVNLNPNYNGEDEKENPERKKVSNEVLEKLGLLNGSSRPVRKPKGDGVYNIYISGIDTYGEISRVSRSDVNIIMTINENTNKILLTTTPRDSYVHIAGQGKNAYDKLTHAGLFGIGTSMATMENLYNIDIDNYVRMNFTSFINIIDSLGGVEIDNPVGFTTRYGENFPAGRIHLDSKRALRYVRERKSLEGGDNDRGKNQERVIAAILAKMNSKEMVSNYSEVINGIASAVQTDVPLSNVIGLAGKKLNSDSNFSVESQALKGYGTFKYKSYMMPNSKLYMSEVDLNSLSEVRDRIYAVEEGR